jgi:hypothetical protein
MSGKPTGCSKLQPMKMVLASFFLLIFSFQVLPVKEIGKILFKGTMIEEIHEAAPDCDETQSKLKKGNDPFTPFKTYPTAGRMLLLVSNGLGTFNPESISKQHIPDIITPPPNRA